ncbi:MAG: DUF5663 domain-containing protein [Patescibacteria group bacterium]|nr:DUF5663 domain-containing protein [Patescibacteria group bacterium]
MDNLGKNIIKELGMDTLSEKEQEELILSIGNIIRQNIILQILQELSEADKNEFDKLLGEKPDDQEAIFKFLKSKIPNLDEITNEEISKFKEESINLMKNISS